MNSDPKMNENDLSDNAFESMCEFEPGPLRMAARLAWREARRRHEVIIEEAYALSNQAIANMDSEYRANPWQLFSDGKLRDMSENSHRILHNAHVMGCVGCEAETELERRKAE